MSQVEEIDSTSMLGAQLRELQNLLERRVAEERETRQQTLIGLERWISDRLAERDISIARRLAELELPVADNTPTPKASPTVPPGETAALLTATTDDTFATTDVLRELRTLGVRLDALEGQLSFIRARQDEFTQLMTTVRAWVASPERTQAQ